MKFIISLIAAAALLLSVTVNAQTPALTAFASGGTDVSTNLCYAVVSANSANGGAPWLTFLSATSDKAGSVVQFYTVGTPTVVTATALGVTNYVASTNGFAANDVVVVRKAATDTYERRVVASFGTGLIAFSAASTTVAGDLIYKATAAGSMPVGNATITYYGGGLYAGQRGKPLLLEVDGTSSCQINAVAAEFK